MLETSFLVTLFDPISPVSMQIKAKGQKLEAETLLKATKMHLENKLEVRWRKVHIKSK